jgi:hypothetical protein
LERLNKNLLAGESLRLTNGKPNPAIQLADHDRDQYLDVISDVEKSDYSVRLWQPETRNWKQTKANRNFAWHTIGFHRDVDGDGTNEWVAWNPVQAALSGIVPDTMLVQFEALDERGERKSAGVKLPSDLPFLFRNYDNGVRLVDVNSDGKLDLVQSVPDRYAIYLFKDWETGWSIKVLDEKRGDPAAKKPIIPPFIRADGTNNGVWFHSGAIWLQNEDTAKLPDGVEKVLFKDLLGSPSR